MNGSSKTRDLLKDTSSSDISTSSFSNLSINAKPFTSNAAAVSVDELQQDSKAKEVILLI